ncbi:MAG: trypsin-like peptidase domain-containing protein [Deltaproteobacteria bacterium]|nr:trypsin-like peptidase domain-containing protein [Deltaproteobacteria bacterium]
MKLCPTCGQSVAEEIAICPSCGSEIGEGRRYIDEYRIIDVLHEGYSSFLCRAIHEPTQEHVMIRLFTPYSGVNEEVADRLKWEIEKLKELPDEGFVHHQAIKRTPDGLWYRISEWIDSESWGSLLVLGRLSNLGILLDLFHQMASILEILHHHGHFIPHLILNDIIAIKGEKDKIRINIDYKLSRFIDPLLDRPSPMLKKLLSSHPDILNQRPLDFRSDIWSLGKVFVELVSADLETMDYLEKIEELDLPSELKVLLRVMLADDPDLRPQSMSEIRESIERIQESLRHPVTVPSQRMTPLTTIRLLQRPQKRVWVLGALTFVIFLIALFAWFQVKDRRKDVESTLENYANQYARSVAFLLVDYWLEADGERVYRNVAEGTAFLVDREGYMLTSRHLACPWLEDPHFAAAVQHLRMRKRASRFGYRIFLWFEGERAFNRAGRMIESPDVDDIYFIENAFSSETSPQLYIAGVAKPPMRMREIFTSPLKDDFALIKIEKVPPGRYPIPLDLEMDPRKLPKLTRVITLGFPLGSRTQTDTVNVSVVAGNIRRTFENMFQIDASLRSGNSGGPVIDARGKAIGILSAVAIDFTQGLVPMITPVWDIGLILPITGAVELLADLKAGHAKWNGLVDFSIEAMLTKIQDVASRGRWAEAMHLVDEKLKKGLSPELVTAAGMLHFCNRDYGGARQRFSESLSMDAKNNQARLMLMLIDWISGGREQSTYQRDLLKADWRSPAEFQSYLARVMEGSVPIDRAIKGWHSPAEKTWVYFISGLVRSREGKIEEAEKLLQEAVLSGDLDSWEFFLSRANLENLRKKRRNSLSTDTQWTEYTAQVERFEAIVRESLNMKKKKQEQSAPLWERLADISIPVEEKRFVLEKALELDPENRMILSALAYCTAAMGVWPDALTYVRRFLATDGRQNAVRMSLGLFEAGILHHQGQEAEVQAILDDYRRRIRDPWFLTICDYLAGRETEDSLRKQAGEHPENFITAFAVIGFWAEGSKDKKSALRLYREVLGTFLDDWLDYGFVRERLKCLKQSSG